MLHGPPGNPLAFVGSSTRTVHVLRARIGVWCIARAEAQTQSGQPPPMNQCMYLASSQGLPAVRGPTPAAPTPAEPTPAEPTPAPTPAPAPVVCAATTATAADPGMADELARAREMISAADATITELEGVVGKQVATVLGYLESVVELAGAGVLFFAHLALR